MLTLVPLDTLYLDLWCGPSLSVSCFCRGSLCFLLCGIFGCAFLDRNGKSWEICAYSFCGKEENTLVSRSVQIKKIIKTRWMKRYHQSITVDTVVAGYPLTNLDISLPSHQIRSTVNHVNQWVGKFIFKRGVDCHDVVATREERPSPWVETGRLSVPLGVMCKLYIPTWN